MSSEYLKKVVAFYFLKNLTSIGHGYQNSLKNDK